MASLRYQIFSGVSHLRVVTATTQHKLRLLVDYQSRVKGRLREFDGFWVNLGPTACATTDGTARFRVG